jgi:hypothetical protein
MIFYCITASITPQVMDKIKAPQYTLQIRGKQIQDGVLLLKVLIDSYYPSTRTTTINLRRQLSNLPYYMKNIAKGDVSKLCQHTRSIHAELEAAGEKTYDLVSNLIAALEEAPNKKFKRWLEEKQNQFIMKEVNWKEDGSDLMDKAETFFLNLRNNKTWWPKHDSEQLYALGATHIQDDTSDTDEDKSKPKAINNLLNQINAFSARLSEKEKREQKYKWKLKPPKDGESTTKMVQVDGVRKKYHWCVNHNAWTLHSQAECKRSGIYISKNRKQSRDIQLNKKPKGQTIEDLQVAFQALANSPQDTDSNTSDTVASNNTWHSSNSQDAIGYETDES